MDDKLFEDLLNLHPEASRINQPPPVPKTLAEGRPTPAYTTPPLAQSDSKPTETDPFISFETPAKASPELPKHATEGCANIGEIVRTEVQAATQQLAFSIAAVLKNVGGALLDKIEGVQSQVEEIAGEVQKVKVCVGDADRSLSHKVSDLDGSLSDAVQGLKSLRDKLDMAEAKRILEEMRSVKLGRISSNMTDDSADVSKGVAESEG